MIRLSAKDVIAAVARDAKLSEAALLGRRNSREVARPRQVAMLLMRRLCPHLSFPEIGRRLGGRDHTTALYGVRKIYSLMPLEPELVAQIERIEARLVADASAQVSTVPVIPFDALCSGYAAVMRQAA